VQQQLHGQLCVAITPPVPPLAAPHPYPRRQVVIIAAGYDTRAYRLARPGVKFYEIDLPHARSAPGAIRATARAALHSGPGWSCAMDQAAVGLMPGNHEMKQGKCAPSQTLCVYWCAASPHIRSPPPRPPPCCSQKKRELVEKLLPKEQVRRHPVTPARQDPRSAPLPGPRAHAHVRRQRRLRRASGLAAGRLAAGPRRRVAPARRSPSQKSPQVQRPARRSQDAHAP
jgi:hypothetical protein